MIRRLITRLLIVFTVLANLGWATELYAGTDGAPASVSQSADTGDRQDGCPPSVDCQHCCHTTVHLLTIPGSGLTFSLSDGRLLCVAVDASLTSFIPAPPYQPPRA